MLDLFTLRDLKGTIPGSIESVVWPFVINFQITEEPSKWLIWCQFHEGFGQLAHKFSELREKNL
jgi:hypothetical protein